LNKNNFISLKLKIFQFIRNATTMKLFNAYLQTSFLFYDFGTYIQSALMHKKCNYLNSAINHSNTSNPKIDTKKKKNSNTFHSSHGSRNQPSITEEQYCIGKRMCSNHLVPPFCQAVQLAGVMKIWSKLK